MTKRRSIVFSFFLVYFTLFAAAPARGAQPAGLADTPWPMYQHDPQHTGRSEFLGITHQPELLWDYPLPTQSSGGTMVLASNGDIICPFDWSISQIDLAEKDVAWLRTVNGRSLSTPMIDKNGDIYWGYQVPWVGTYAAKFSSDGKPLWRMLLDHVEASYSSPTFGPNGDWYSVHNALWSFTSSDSLRWVYSYGDYANTSPTVGHNGLIYAPCPPDANLCAFDAKGNVEQTFPSLSGYLMTPAIGADGTIYYPQPVDNVITALDPSGVIKWQFSPGGFDGIAIAPDETIYFATNPFTTDDHRVYAVRSTGELKWSVPIPMNPETHYGGIYHELVTDRVGNVFLCSNNSYCYGIDANGNVMWQFDLKPRDSIPTAAMTSMLIAADGLMFVETAGTEARLLAFGDPSSYPQLTASEAGVGLTVESGSPAFTMTLAISSTVAPLSYTVSLTATDWLSISVPLELTPSNIVLHISPATLPKGTFRTELLIRPTKRFGKWLKIPVVLNVGVRNTYLPSIMNNYQRPYRIVYLSWWFWTAGWQNATQLASIEQDGTDRQKIVDLTFQSDRMIYSPDAHKVAIVTHRNDLTRQIAVLDTVTGQRLLDLMAPDSHRDCPAWSPDSNRLVFCMSDDYGLNKDLYMINLDGTGLRQLTSGVSVAQNVYWSPKGDKIAFLGGSPSSVRVMNADGSNMYNLLPNNPGWWSPVGWSPDGRYLLLLRMAYDSPWELFAYDFQLNSLVNLLGPQYAVEDAAWSPDGGKIAFVGCAVEQSHCDIYVMNPDGSGIQNLTNSYDRDFNPVWSPDGKWIAFVDQPMLINADQNYDINVVRRDGTGLQRITANVDSDSNPVWVPYDAR